MPDGAFYCLVDAAPLIGEELPDDGALALHLLEHGVAVVPASAFGGALAAAVASTRAASMTATAAIAGAGALLICTVERHFVPAAEVVEEESCCKSRW